MSTRTGSYTYASVQLSDCSRTINLEFDVNDANEYENNLHKVDTMIKTLQKFRRAVAKAQR